MQGGSDVVCRCSVAVGLTPVRLAALRGLARLKSFAALLLPSMCALCGRPGAGTLCEHCAGSLTDAQTLRCTSCASRLPREQGTPLCGACLRAPPSFDETRVVADYAPPVDTLVKALKFRAQLPLACAFAQQLVAATPPQLRTADLILPVPLSRERLTSRGFNQALEIARPIARAWKLPLARDACVRTRDTQAQASLPLAERRVNMRGAFAVQDRAAIAGRHVLVVDDVMTTGHTLNELAACLKRHGAVRVSNLVLARTPVR